MFKHSFIIALRNLSRNKIFTSVNIIGFSIGLASFVLLALYIHHELSFDRFHKDSNRIYQVIDSSSRSSLLDMNVKPLLVENYPEIQTAALINQYNTENELSSKDGKIIKADYITVADSSFFKIFSFKLLNGNADYVFKNKNSIVLTESIARKLYGHTDPLGEEVNVNQRWKCTVAAIISDPPANSSIQFDYILNSHQDTHLSCSNCGPDVDKQNIIYNYNIFIKLIEASNIKNLKSKINNNSILLSSNSPLVIDFEPLTDLYLDSDYDSPFKKGNSKLLNVLGAISIIILILAIVNYINLTISRSSLRIKEIGIKKAIGANRKTIILQFISESTIICILSFILAVLITNTSLPYFMQIIESSIYVPDLNFQFVLILAIFPILLGILTGILPGYILSKLKPLSLVSEKIKSFGKYRIFKTSLNIFQFTISIILFISILVITKQLDFVKNKDLGFQDEQLLRINMIKPIYSGSSNKVSVFKSQLIQHPSISTASSTGGTPGDIQLFMEYKDKNQEKHRLSVINIDSNFFKTFQIELMSGRGLVSSDLNNACYLNQTAMEDLKIEDIDGELIHDKYEIIGVVKDFHFTSLKDRIQPLCLVYGNYGNYYLNVRIDNNVAEAMPFIQQKWKEIYPDFLFQYEFFDDKFDSMYKSEESLSKLISFFSIIGMIISALGIFALAEFASKQRKKEIGIRKIVGASVQNIVFLLSKYFTRLIIISFVIAIPFSIWIMNQWLESFSYKTPLDWWIFAIAGAVSLIIALITVSFQTIKAALSNPVEALRIE